MGLDLSDSLASDRPVKRMYFCMCHCFVSYMDGVYTNELQALASRTFRRSDGKFSDALVALLVSFHIKSTF